MPIKIVWEEGRPVAFADTTAEAIELLKANFNGTDLAEKKSLPKSRDEHPANEGARIQSVFQLIQPRAKKLLAAISKHEIGAEADQLSEEIGEPTAAFGGFLGHVTKTAEKYGIRGRDLVVSKFETKGSRRFRFIKPGALLIKYASNLAGNTEPSWKADARKMLAEREEEESRGGRMKSGGGA